MQYRKSVYKCIPKDILKMAAHAMKMNRFQPVHRSELQTLFSLISHCLFENKSCLCNLNHRDLFLLNLTLTSSSKITRISDRNELDVQPHANLKVPT